MNKLNLVTNQAEILLLDFFKTLKENINFKAIKDNTLHYESPKQKFLNLATVWVDSRSFKIIDARLAITQQIISKSNSYLLVGLPNPKSINKLLAFHTYVKVDLHLENSSYQKITLVNGVFRYTKRKLPTLPHFISQCMLDINCRLSPLEVIKLLDLIDE